MFVYWLHPGTTQIASQRPQRPRARRAIHIPKPRPPHRQANRLLYGDNAVGRHDASRLDGGGRDDVAGHSLYFD
ncbi:hypothetical protein [Geobacillus zalihae]|uniref:hypothetical protein n=1 Tax=Geobacillus zalihae TaxID=213419 RepID=UPI000429F620|nr:hypothetical protein [Geobacillus zalihae]QNU23554.1 hypothetical protein IC806_10365 [Geobacillus zalihae]